MLISDKVYGTFDLTEPVLLELINSKPLQRLKGISQYGLPPEMYHHKGFSRYDHCVGVMLLLRKLGASIEEQVAGLLHDLSHTAFSHVVDWVVGNQIAEDYQDQMHQKIIMDSDIPGILLKYGFEVSTVLDYHNYPLLEQPAPGLCADRIAYALREFLDWAVPEIAPVCVSALIQQNHKIVFSSRDAADQFARAFLKCQTEHWGAAETCLRYHLLAEALKTAIAAKVISFDDLYQDDRYVLKKLKQSTNSTIQRSLALLSGQLHFTVNPENQQYSFHKKFRYVDPEFLEKGSVQRLSPVDPSYQLLLEHHRKINEQGIKVSLRQ